MWGNTIRFYEYTLKHGEAVRLYNNLGMAYADVGRVVDAVSQYEKALEYGGGGGGYPQVYHNLGNAYGQLGELDKARENFEKAIEVSPGFFHSYLPIVRIYLIQEDYEEALKKMDEMIALGFYAVDLGVERVRVLVILDRVD